MELQLQSRNKRQNESFIKRIIDTLHKISREKFIYSVLIFFISMARLPFGSFSAGAAIFAAEYTAGVPFFAGILVLIGGFAGSFSPFEMIKTVSAMLIFSAAAAKFNLKKSPLLKSGTIALCTLFCSIVPKLFSTLYLYDTLILILEAAITFALCTAFQKAKPLFTPSAPKADTLLPAAVFIALAIMGVSSINIGSVNLGVLLCMLFVLIMAYENGIGAAGGIGIIAGCALGASLDSLPYFVTLFAVSSLAAGAFASFGKGSSALSFVLCASIVTFYSPSTLLGFVNLTLSSAAAMIFMLLPKKVTSPFSVFKGDAKSPAARFKEYMSKELYESAAVIGSISNSFTELCNENTAKESGAALSFFERTTGHLCSDCSLKNHCWRSEFHRTYSAFFVLIEICNKRGSISYCDIPEELMKKCIKAHSIVGAFNTMYDIYRVDRLWECRILESRSMVSTQLKCIADTLKQKAGGAMNKVFFMPDAEAKLSRRFADMGIETESIFVCRKGDGGVTVDIDFADKISPEIAQDIVKSVLKDDYRCVFSYDNFMRLSLFPPHALSTATAQKARSGNTKSGDTAAFSYAPGGKYMMILSDGMGSGERAGADSSAAASLAEKMLRGGFEAIDAIKIINSALILKSNETSFASVDMALLNFREGVADFYKMGAAPAFIKNGKSVKTIYAATLPAGSFSESDIGHISHSLTSGDSIIMVSDGVANGENTAELEEIISDFSGSAEEMANMLISYCTSKETEISDDMTVMVTCIN